MKVYRLGGEYLDENTYIVVEGESALVIDPGASAERVLAACDTLAVKPLAVLLTHGHVDHIFGAPALQAVGIPVYLHQEELEVIEGRANLALVFHLSLAPFCPDRLISSEDPFKVGPFSVTPIFTPGHTKGGVCYWIDGVLFSGDTLFKGSYGRVDLPTGDEQDLLCSIANELFALHAKTPVYTGHGDGYPSSDLTLATVNTTIGEEYYTNPILHLL